MKKAEREAKLLIRREEMRVYEENLYTKGIDYIGGVDEVGRGPLAGPVCAACVILPKDFDVLGIDDSKKVSEKKRCELYDLIIEKAIAYGIGLIDNNRIDEINILNATKEAMLIAIKEAEQMLQKNKADNDCKIEHLLVDALKLPEAKIPGTALIKGDTKSVSIASASILAKVFRDRMMIDFDETYPGYSFASNKGYGTKAHYEGLDKLGLTPIHRKTFLKDF